MTQRFSDHFNNKWKVLGRFTNSKNLLETPTITSHLAHEFQWLTFFLSLFFFSFYSFNASNPKPEVLFCCYGTPSSSFPRFLFWLPFPRSLASTLTFDSILLVEDRATVALPWLMIVFSSLVISCSLTSFSLSVHSIFSSCGWLAISIPSSCVFVFFKSKLCICVCSLLHWLLTYLS